MPPRTLNPELLRLLQGMPSLQGLPQAPQQIQAPAPSEQPDFAPPIQQQTPQQTQQPTQELGQKEMLENKFGQQYRALLSKQSTSDSNYEPYSTGINLLKKGGVGGILGGLAALAGSPLGAGIIGLGMDPYEGAGLYQGAAAGEARRVQQKKQATQDRQKKIEQLRKYLESEGGGDLKKFIAKTRAGEEIKAEFAKFPEELAQAAALKAGAIAEVQQPYALEKERMKYNLKSEYDKQLASEKLETTLAKEKRTKKAQIEKDVRKKLAGLTQLEGLISHLKPQLDKIKLERIPLLGESPIGEKISGLTRVAKSFVGADPAVKAYRVEVKSILGQFARTLSQEMGVLTDHLKYLVLGFVILLVLGQIILLGVVLSLLPDLSTHQKPVVQLQILPVF